MNLSPYSMAQLHTAKHEYELSLAMQQRGAFVMLDSEHMGVGGDDSWSPSVHEQYLVRPGLHSFSLALLPIQLQ